jgi:amino acid permease
MFFSSHSGGVQHFAGSADGPEYWDELDAHHARHRRSLIVLTVAAAVLFVGGIAVSSAFIALAIALLAMATVQFVMFRKSRSRVPIPDYRPMPPADVELDGPGA